MIDGIIQVIMGTIGTLGFSILFNVRGKRLVFATLGGCISWTWYIIFNGMVNNEVLSYFVSAALTTVYCEIMARVIKTPTTSFILPSLVGARVSADLPHVQLRRIMLEVSANSPTSPYITVLHSGHL